MHLKKIFILIVIVVLIYGLTSYSFAAQNEEKNELQENKEFIYYD